MGSSDLNGVSLSWRFDDDGQMPKVDSVIIVVVVVMAVRMDLNLHSLENTTGKGEYSNGFPVAS